MVRRQYGIPDPVPDNSIGAASEEDDAPTRHIRSWVLTEQLESVLVLVD